MPEPRENPVLVSARREAAIVLVIWVVACLWTIGVSYRLGYGRDASTLTYVFGFPDWIFWGVILPWSTCTLLCWIVPRFFIRDEDLGEDRGEEEVAGGL